MPSVQVTFDGVVKLEVSGDVNLNIVIPPELQAFLNQIIPNQNQNKNKIQEPKETKPVIVEPKKAEPDKTKPVTTPKIKKEKKKVVKREPKPKKPPETPEPEWEKGPNGIKLKYRTEGNKLFLKYFSGEVETTWDKMIQISNVPENIRKSAIITVLNSKENKPITDYKETAINLFIKYLDVGAIKDPDWKFRPLLDSSSYSTRIDPNCSSGESMM
ncbi:MAG: hypothetical protein PHS04_12935, partial [Tissierellia bacterium]|nr:hypothetical protein [Tissierellia bacterium]